MKELKICQHFLARWPWQQPSIYKVHGDSPMKLVGTKSSSILHTTTANKKAEERSGAETTNTLSLREVSSGY